MNQKIILIEMIKENAVESMKITANGMNRPVVDPLKEDSVEVDRIIKFLETSIHSLIPDNELEGELLEQYEALKEVNILDFEPTVADMLTPWDYHNMAHDLYNELLVTCRWEIAQRSFRRLEQHDGILSYDVAKRFIQLYRLKCMHDYVDWYNAFQPCFLPANPEVYYNKNR